VLANPNPVNPNTNSTVGTLAPHSGTLLALLHPTGGYVGGTKNKLDFVRIVQQIGEAEAWIYEALPSGRFSLKQRATNLYLGMKHELNERLGLVDLRQNCEIFALESKGNGLFAIKNDKGYFLTKKNDQVVWTNFFSQQETWRFDVAPSEVQHQVVNNNSQTTTTSGPVNGQLYGLKHYTTGHYVGGVKNLGTNIMMVPKLNDWEHWYFENYNGKISLKQKASNLYLGRSNSLGERLGLVQARQNCEMFDLVPQANGLFGIRS